MKEDFRAALLSLRAGEGSICDVLDHLSDWLNDAINADDMAMVRQINDDIMQLSAALESEETAEADSPEGEVDATSKPPEQTA